MVRGNEAKAHLFVLLQRLHLDHLAIVFLTKNEYKQTQNPQENNATTSCAGGHPHTGFKSVQVVAPPAAQQPHSLSQVGQHIDVFIPDELLMYTHVGYSRVCMYENESKDCGNAAAKTGTYLGGFLKWTLKIFLFCDVS